MHQVARYMNRKVVQLGLLRLESHSILRSSR
jgi:hypothetical protein